ncbi:protein GLUTAMINE DUMPER 2-like [Rutidosis leptorrhynchoides]|uniref:protein GLUTAMINE DUMPER 2-like n=1 Tax=Rutidosis leptorrhynchoides TaxID=125765 RepID=UPI003A9A165B
MTLQAASVIAPSSPMIIHRSPWHSPVPYLFGGLAAMLSLIAFALLILACSYSKRAGNGENGDRERDIEAGDSKADNNDKDLAYVFEEKYLVIMAGQANPTFIATPVSSKVTSFCSCSCQKDSTEKLSNDKEKEESSDQLQVRNTENHEAAEQQS